MSRHDLCSVGPGGVVVTERQLTNEAVRALSTHIYELVCALCLQLRPYVSHLWSPRGARMALHLDLRPERVVSRATVTYILRYLESAELLAGSFLDGVVFLSIIAANVEHRVGQATGEALDDESRRRTPVLALARNMGLPPETVRRRVHALIARDLCARDGDGVFVPTAVLKSPAIKAEMERNRANLQRFLVDLDRAGFQYP